MQKGAYPRMRALFCGWYRGQMGKTVIEYTELPYNGGGKGGFDGWKTNCI